NIAVTPKTVLTHAEVQANLGIKQRNKWDIAVLPFDRKVVGAKAIGDKLRSEVKEAIAAAPHLHEGEPVEPPLKRGDRGDRVKDLQTLLLNAGFDPNGIDGIWGGATQAALDKFQAQRGLKKTGLA